MSLNTATKEQLKELIQYISDNICLPIIGVGGGDAPIGKMGMFDAIIAPQGWLIADGSEYNIDDYPELATHIASTHGSMNYYGGDGTTTFAVPDWQGEFFRASGTNAHTNQGDGANVGVHQDASEINNMITKSSANQFQAHTSTSGSAWEPGVKNYDSRAKTGDNKFLIFNASSSGTDLTGLDYVTTRPTNTSLLCCIKATPQGHQYSEKEQIVGSWVNGDTIYEKSFILGITNLEKDAWVDTSVDGSNIAAIIDGKFIRTSPNPTAVVPLVCNLQVSVNYETHKVRINPPIVLSSCANGYITIQYTKLS